MESGGPIHGFSAVYTTQGRAPIYISSFVIGRSPALCIEETVPLPDLVHLSAGSEREREDSEKC